MIEKRYKTPELECTFLLTETGMCAVSNKNYPGSETEDWDREDLGDDIWED